MLIVHDLPTAANPDGRWLVDAGLGDGLHEPLPLVPGDYRQGPFTFRLTRRGDGGWHLDHDELGSFAGVAITADPVAMTRFEERHHFLSTSPESSFARTPTVQRRRADGVDMLRGLVLTSIGPDGVTQDRSSRTVTSGSPCSATLGLRLRIARAGSRAAVGERHGGPRLLGRAAPDRAAPGARIRADRRHLDACRLRCGT